MNLIKLVSLRLPVGLPTLLPVTNKKGFKWAYSLRNTTIPKIPTNPKNPGPLSHRQWKYNSEICATTNDKRVQQEFVLGPLIIMIYIITVFHSTSKCMNLQNASCLLMIQCWCFRQRLKWWNLKFRTWLNSSNPIMSLSQILSFMLDPRLLKFRPIIRPTGKINYF